MKRNEEERGAVRTETSVCPEDRDLGFACKKSGGKAGQHKKGAWDLGAKMIKPTFFMVTPKMEKPSEGMAVGPI